MAPRKRKVAVVQTNSPEKVKYSTAVIQTLLNAQKNETTHAKLVKQLKQQYATVQHDSFMKSFILVIKRQMEHDETNDYANKMLKFCAKFVADPEFSEQAVTHPVVATIFDWLLSTISSSQLVRFRICQLVNLILNALGMDAALDDAICDKILRYMLERMRDVAQHVRVQAVLALQRLQDPNSPEDPVFRAYIYHLDNDPSPKVRQTIISSLGRSYRSIPHILERLWDVDQRVRRHTYMQMSNYPVQQYKVAQRLKFLEQGLVDRAEGVRKVMRNVMIPQWMESYQRDYVAFIEALKLDADEKEMDRFLKTSKMVLTEIFSKNGVKEMAQLLNFTEENKTVPLAELTIERCICWQAMLEYLQKNDPDHLEDYMIELSKFCEYVKQLTESPDKAAFMKTSNASISTVGSQTSSPNQSETMDKLQQLYFQYILQLLLEIVSIYDFGDEFGRESLTLVLSDLLCNEVLYETNVRLVVETFEKLITDVEARLNFFVNLVTSVLEPSRQDVSHSSRMLIDTYLERHPELKPLKLQISTLRVKILDLKEEESSLSAQKDYAGAQQANEKLNICNEEYANLIKPFVQEMSSFVGDSSTLSIFRDSLLKPRRVTQATIEKCLQICFYLVNSPTVRVITPNVCELYRSFISRHVQSGQLSTRNWALRASTAFSMLYDGLSKETFQLLYQQFLNTASTRLWKTAIECVFELLDKYGFAHFDLENEDTSKDDSRSSKSSRQLFNRHQNGSYSDELSQSTSCNGNEFYKMSIHFMDTCDDSAICATIIEGFCRLILRGKCTSADIMSKLLLRLFNPTTDPEMLQMLGIFFQGLIAKRRQEILQKALLSTLFVVLEAPNESPLAEVHPETVIKFVINSTKPVFCSPGVNPHNTIAVTFLRVMRDNLSLKDLLKLLSREILTLDIKEDPALRADLANTADEILREPQLDPKTVKNLTTFRQMMLGQIRETLSFSSSRGGKYGEADATELDTVHGEETVEKDAGRTGEGVLDDEEETEQEENEDEEERADERPRINKSILQEDSDTDLLASPLRPSHAPESGFVTPEKRTDSGTESDPSIKSLRRSLVFGSNIHLSPRVVITDCLEGTFKVPGASALKRIKAARAKEAQAASKKVEPEATDEDFEIPATNDWKSSEEQDGSSDSEIEIPETQSPEPTSASRRRVSRPGTSARSNRKSIGSSSSSSSESEVVDGSPNVTTSRIKRAVRPLNKVSAKTLYERKLQSTPGTLPRITRHASRLEVLSTKRVTRKSLSELTSTAATSPLTASKSQLPARTAKKTTETNDANSSGKPSSRPSRKSDVPEMRSPVPRVASSEPSGTPKSATRSSARVSSTRGSTVDQEVTSPGSKRSRPKRLTLTKSPALPSASERRTESGENESGTSASSPVRLKRVAVVLTPLSAIKQNQKQDGSMSISPVATSPRRPNRKATRK